MWGTQQELALVICSVARGENLLKTGTTNGVSAGGGKETLALITT